MSRAVSRLRIVAHFGRHNRGLLEADGVRVPCALGRGGVRHRKREGDGATPAGSFALGCVYYRPDRLARPATGLEVRPIDPGLGWSDDPADPLYNRAVRLPRAFGHERLWREDHLYDLLVVVGYNLAPALRPLGSAIFLHLAHADRRPTEGCVAIAPAAMHRLLPRLGPRTRLIVAA